MMLQRRQRPNLPFILQRFCDAYRKNFKDTNPDASFGKITQLLAAAWKEATDDEKAPFQAAYEVMRNVCHQIGSRLDRRES